MSKYQKHLYAIMYPNSALVASQLPPHEFGRYYSVGTARYYSGKMVFVEVDIGFRHDYFPIDEYLALTVEHEDGTPKMTKFIASYRVLEHLDFKSLGAMSLVTVNGEVLRIDRQEYRPLEDPGRVRIIQELNPIQLLVASTYDQKELGRYLTTAGNPKGAPKLLFTQLDLNVEKFLGDWKANPFLSPPIPGVHPQKLAATLEALLEDGEPRTKSIGIQSVFDRVSYAGLRHGFFLAQGEELLFYPMPSQEQLQRDHYTWWKSSAV